MKYTIVLIFFCVCVKCNVLLHNNLITTDIDKTVIPTEIISNYLQKYLSCDEVFLSISLTSPNDDREYFQEDLISNLVVNSKLENFSYNILNKVDQSRRGNRNVFNLVFIDRSALLT